MFNEIFGIGHLMDGGTDSSESDLCSHLHMDFPAQRWNISPTNDKIVGM
jgi:hypothetical protein